MSSYNIILLGAGGVGKSAITIRYVLNTFSEKYDPTIEDSYRKRIQINNEDVVLELLDTAGTEQFNAMRDLYMKTGHAFVFVYDITSAESMQTLRDYINKLLSIRGSEKVPMMIVGNKCDSVDDRVISVESGEAFAKEFDAQFKETSAKNNINIELIFTELVTELHKSGKSQSSKKSKCSLL